MRAPQNRRQFHNDVEAVSEVFTREADQESNLPRRERWRIVRRGLKSLNVRYRTAVLLRYVHNTPIREIAGVLQCSENMTKNILFRGIRTLRPNLAESD